MNTVFNYLYRDGSNYKQWGSVIFEGTITDALTRRLASSSSLISFAYPKSLDGSSGARRAVAERFRSAALAGTRPNRYGATDVFRIARSPIQNGDGRKWFRAKAAGGMVFEDDVRRLLNRVRYAGADR